MTSLHHYDCPVTKRLIADPDVDFIGIIENGVSENYDAKVATAVKTGKMADELELDGAIVAIDGWGNHHIDFVSVIEQLGIHDIPSVGLSYIGRQGRLVATNEYVETVVDFNKESSGYESCVVGQNNLTDMDAYKAIAILKNKVRKYNYKYINSIGSRTGDDYIEQILTRDYYKIKECKFGDKTSVEDGVLTLREGIEKDFISKEPRVRDIHIQFIRPDDDRNFFINSNLDFMPIACKTDKDKVLGKGRTMQLDGIKVMMNGVEDTSGFQPANIGSSEGILTEHVKFDEAGTPKSSDIILHIDFLFEEGEGRTAEGICAAHEISDAILNEIRSCMQNLPADDSEQFILEAHPTKMRIGLVKICSGLGNMYDTSVFPSEPAGYIGSYLTRDTDNEPVFMTATQVLDGAIHSLI
jgi:hypothetical protein